MMAAASEGRLDVLYLLGADEIDMSRLGSAFVIYQGSHGDAGAHRADVILPGAAYTEKDAIYVNLEGRAQMTAKAAFPPGEAREDWTILRQLSALMDATLPFDTIGALRALMVKAAPALAALDTVTPAAMQRRRAPRRAQGKTRHRAVRGIGTRLLSRPIRSRAPRRSWPSCRPSRRATAAYARRRNKAGQRRMFPTTFDTWWDYALWLALTVGASLLLLVTLLIIVAFLLLMDRKVWAAVQLRRGPNVVGPFGLLQSFADLLKFVLKEPLIPAGADKGVFLLAPLVTAVLALAAWAVIPVGTRASVISDLNVGILYLFAISSLGVYGVIMGGWASNSKYPFLGSLRSAAQMVSYEVSIGFVIITVLLLRRLAQHDARSSPRSRPASAPAWACRTRSSTGTGCRCSRCSSCSSSRRWPRPTGRRSTCPRRNRSWSPASWSNIRRRPTCCSCSASTWPSSPCAR